MTADEQAQENRDSQLSAHERDIVEGKPTSIARAAAAAAVREAKAKPAAPRKVPQIQRGDVELAEFKVADWAVVAGHGTQPEDLDLKPEQWSMVADKINAGDLIRVRARDDSWFAIYVAIGGGTFTLNAKMLMATELPEPTGEGNDMPDGYEVRKGDAASDPWIVVRLADAHIMNVGQGHRSREDARRWLKDHAIFRRPAY